MNELKITHKMMNNSLDEFFNDYASKLKKIDIRVRPLFSTALKGAYKAGFINGFDECRKLRGKKHGK